MQHVALLGDSVFDNAAYVPGEPAVIEQLREELGAGWEATLLAVDGDVTADVAHQLRGLPDTTTHLVVSVGGNDALQHAYLLDEAASIDAIAHELARIQVSFGAAYDAMFDSVEEHRLPMAVCTIYDRCPIPGEYVAELLPAALAFFNDVIVDVARQRGADLVDLREICTEPGDYSVLSPIEPSVRGGHKIVRAISHCLNPLVA